MENHEKQITGTVEDFVVEVALLNNVRLDKDKFELLRLISKTRYSGLTKEKLTTSLSFLKDKEDSWFQEIIEDGLAETFSFSTPKVKVKSWEGWFIANKGRKVIKDVMNKM